MTKHFKLPTHQPALEHKKSQGEKGLDWLKSHQEMIAVGALLVLLLIFGIPYYQKSQRQTEKDASNMLNQAEYYMNSPVDAKNGPFKTEEDKFQQSLQTFQRILNNYSGTASEHSARYYVAKCQYLLKQYPQAYASFDAAISDLKNTPLADAAMIGKIYAMSAQDQTQEANKLYEKFIKEQPKSFLLPEARLSYSDSLMKANEKAKALDVLKALAKDLPDTYWGREAQRRVKNFGA